MHDLSFTEDSQGCCFRARGFVQRILRGLFVSAVLSSVGVGFGKALGPFVRCRNNAETVGHCEPIPLV